MRKIAVVVASMCDVKHVKYGIRYEKRGNTWFKTWAFPFKKDKTEYDDTNTGSLNFGEMDIDKNYPGCPFCQTDALIQCGNCNKISCYHGSDEFNCPWCGFQGIVTSGGWDSVNGGGY